MRYCGGRRAVQCTVRCGASRAILWAVEQAISLRSHPRVDTGCASLCSRLSMAAVSVLTVAARHAPTPAPFSLVACGNWGRPVREPTLFVDVGNETEAARRPLDGDAIISPREGSLGDTLEVHLIRPGRVV